MALCKAEAVTLRLTDFSETSQVAVFYTREFGRISALAKGSKRPGNNFEGRLDLLCHNDIVFARKRSSSLHTLTECKLLDRFMGLRAGAERMYAGLYLAELVIAMTQPEESDPRLFALLVTSLRALGKGQEVDLVVLSFEVRLLALCGFAPSLEACVNCGATELGRASVRYSPLLGGVLCRKCREADGRSVGVPRGALAALARIADGTVSQPSRLKLPPSIVAALRKLMKATVAHQLGREPKLARYV